VREDGSSAARALVKADNPARCIVLGTQFVSSRPEQRSHAASFADGEQLNEVKYSNQQGGNT